MFYQPRAKPMPYTRNRALRHIGGILIGLVLSLGVQKTYNRLIFIVLMKI
jgi:hypothetical protein